MTLNKICFTLLLNLVLSFSFTTSMLAKSTSVEKAQKILNKLGYYEGDIDGRWGKKSRKSLNTFQKKHGFNTSKRLSNGLLKALQTVDEGGKRNFVPISERIGNTLIVNSGEKIYYDTDGTKIIKLKSGKSVKRKWRKMKNGKFCETLYNKSEFCEGKSKSKYVIFKVGEKTHWFRLNGWREWEMTLKEGKKL